MTWTCCRMLSNHRVMQNRVLLWLLLLFVSSLPASTPCLSTSDLVWTHNISPSSTRFCVTSAVLS